MIQRLLSAPVEENGFVFPNTDDDDNPVEGSVFVTDWGNGLGVTVSWDDGDGGRGTANWDYPTAQALVFALLSHGVPLQMVEAKA